MKKYTHNDLVEAVIELADVSLVEDILKSGVKPDDQESSSYTPLMFAVMPDEHGDHDSPKYTLDLARKLVDYGADPTILSPEGLSAIDYAKQLQDPKWKDRFGDSANSRWREEVRPFLNELLILLQEDG